MKVWKVCGSNLPMIEVEAECFDDAIRKARKINPNYDSGQLKA